MELDSARELKSKLIKGVAASFERAITSRRLSVAAQPMRHVGPTPGTIALGIARKGRKGFVLAVRLQRQDLSSSAELDRIRKQAKGEIEERYVGRISKQGRAWHQGRSRPLLIGGSVGHHGITAGTLGCFATDRASKQPLILSNNHVLADENRGKLGDDIIQPGTYDGGGRPKDVVGQLYRVVKLKREGANAVDSAVASIDQGIRFDAATLKGLGKLAGLGDAFLDEGTEVSKIGRTTGLTEGRITAFEMDNVVVEYGIGPLRFDNQMEIESTGDWPFSDGGDSGSLILSRDLRGVGQLFAGSDSGGAHNLGLTYATPLRNVLDALKIDLLYS